MESVLWSFKTLTGFSLSAPIVQSLFILLLLCWEYILLLPRCLWLRARAGAPARRRLPAGEAPSALVVIPSLLRRRDELTSMFSTIDSVATNGYPGELFIVVSIDGCADAPALYAELTAWAARRAPDVRGRCWLYVTGTPGRRGKPMAIEHAVRHLQGLVASGVHAAFPRVYISTDADADLGPNALESLVARLVRRHPLTGWPARAVAGNLYIRGNAFWRGWRRFFTPEGQITLQVAREYLVTNVARHNLRWMPLSGVPGVLYCTWTEIFLEAPRFMGYMRTLRARDCLKWWAGAAPPSFERSRAAAIPELLAGDTDDTVSAYLAIIARWKDGRFTLDPPRTPLHAFVYMLRALFIDRALRYEPGARVYTSSPTSIKALFKQRRRWNCSRIEVTGRFWRAMWFNWSLGLPAHGIMFLIAKYCLLGGLVYLRLPMALVKSTILTAFVLGYSCQLAGYSMLTLFALVLNGERSLWRLALALPLSPLYAICFTYAPSVVGAVNDVVLFGNVTGFAPETTLIRGGSSRIALLYRARRAFLLAVRAVRRGDVPWGAFWFGWGATKFTPSGYEGWTSGKRPSPVLRPTLVRRAPVAPGPSVPAMGFIPEARPPRAAVVSAQLAVLLACAGAAALLPSHARAADVSPADLEPIEAAAMTVTSGALSPTAEHGIAIRSPTVRAVVRGGARAAVELAFVYRGPSDETAPLASGEARRQIGLELRARDTCNVLYVMWHIEPTTGIHVALKTNPGERTHARCRDRGYQTLAPTWSRPASPVVRAGERRTLRATIDGDVMRVSADGAPVWTGRLPPAALALDGPVGLRTDNGDFDFMLRASPAREGAR